MEILNSVIEKLKNRGFCDVGVCSAEPFNSLRPKLKKTEVLLKGFVDKDIEKRIDPALTMPDVKSIIVVAKSYNQKIVFKEDKLPRGYVSLGAIGEDDHLFMERELKAISNELYDIYGGEYMVFSDTGPLCDRELALRSGIGYLGQNGSVITDNGGAMTFIGYILTSLELEAGQAQKKNCSQSCKKCITACPTGTLNEGEFKIEKCISYLTQLKRNLSLEETKAIGINLYGCDVCQKVCPKTKETGAELLDIEEVMPRIKDILSLSNREFKEKYGHTAMGWRGNSVIKRNALAALGNINQEDSLEMLLKYSDTENDFLRYGAISGIINLEKEEGKAVLKEVYRKEKNSGIKEVIEWAIGIQED